MQLAAPHAIVYGRLLLALAASRAPIVAGAPVLLLILPALWSWRLLARKNPPLALFAGTCSESFMRLSRGRRALIALWSWSCVRGQAAFPPLSGGEA